MRNAIISTIVATVFLAGCQTPSAPPPAKWQGPPYRLTAGAQPAKSNPAGATLPAIYFTANPEGVERRANLVMKIDTTSIKKPGKSPDEILMRPTDISGPRGQLSDSYLNESSTELAKLFTFYGLKGNIKVNVALVKSSVMMSAPDEQVDVHRLSDWVPIVVEFKNPHLR